MRAAVLRSSPGDLVVEDLVVDAPRAREVLVRTAHAGLCHSDLHFMEGTWQLGGPAVMGHEAAGVVEAVGDDVHDVRPGDHVITCVSIFCGACRYCVSGRPHLCARRAELVERPGPSLRTASGEPVGAFASLGAFAEQMLVHEHAVVKIRDEVPLQVAALVGCACTTGLGAVFRTAAVRPGSSVAVVGCGGVGLSAVQGARLCSASPVIAVDVSAEKLARAQALGATHVVDARAVDPVEAVRELTGGGVDYSFEAIGLKATAEQCFAMLARGGTATVIGMIPPDVLLEIPGAQLFMEEKRLQGSLMGSNQFRVDMPWFCDLYLDGRLLLDEMVSAHCTLDAVNEGYAAMRRGDGARTVIDFA